MKKDGPKPGKGQEILDKLGDTRYPERKNRTVSLNNYNYLSLLYLCEIKGLTLSRVLDELIANFLDEVSPTWKDQDIAELVKKIEEAKKDKQANEG